MSNLINFDFKNQPVRTIADEHGEVWFVASDVCNILGYANSRKAIDDHCKPKGVTKRYTPTECDVTNSYTTSKARKSQEMTYINEPNLYRLIIKSRKPEAEKFEEWVMEEVLPSIRKTGSYSLPTPQTLSTVKDRNGLVKTCEWFVRVASYLGYDEVWNLVHHRFNINRACELTTEQVGQATEYLQGLLLGVIAQRREFNPQTPLPLPPMHRTDVGKYDNDGVLWTRVLEPDEQIVRTKDIAQLIINEPYIDGETLTAINYASSARLASMLKNPPFLTTLDNAKEV